MPIIPLIHTVLICRGFFFFKAPEDINRIKNLLHVIPVVDSVKT